jgi:hypothetical protein
MFVDKLYGHKTGMNEFVGGMALITGAIQIITFIQAVDPK